MRNDCLNLQLIKTEQTGLQPSFLRVLRDDFGLTTFMETGTFRGDTTAVAARIFESVHSFELSAELHANALKRFSGQTNVHLHHGDSAELLPAILASGPRERILFWLDGHFSGGPTAQGKVNTPILDEIRAIAAAGIKDCVVLVDDLRCFQTSGPGTPHSLTGYPTIWELREALRAIFPKLSFAHYGDVAMAFSADTGPALSPVLQGCTVSRLFDSLPADFAAPPVEELFQAEQLVAHAAGSELEAIVALASAYPSGEKHGLGGHYQLWAGLALNQAGKLADARKCFGRALELNCDHWRVRCYLAAALGEMGEMGEAFMELNEARLLAPGQPLVTAIEQTLLQAKVQQRESSAGRGASGRSTPSSANPEANGETAVLRRFIKPGSVVFDVGAHAGHWTDAVLAHCPTARVHLFEPLPAHAQTLRERFAEGIGRGQLSVEACALGERDEAREFHHYTASPAWSGLHRRRSVEREAGVQPPESLQVRVMTLDDYCRSAGVSRIGFLKIDVEGGELAVLRGAQQLLRRGDIDFLQFEYGGTYRDAGVTLREVFGFLQGLGYLMFRITAAGVEHCPGFSPAMEDYSYANYLAVHPRFRTTLLENKPRMLDLAALSSEHGLHSRGVIHIGAHEGKEYERYQAMGFGKILFVEANPAVFARLKARLDGKPGVVLANCAISDRAGTAKLRVTSMDQSSSLLPLKLHSKIYPDIVETQQVEVHTITLDALLEELALNPADFNFLNIDIQGAELLALCGAEKTLHHIQAINTEVNLAELYEGCARLEEVDLHLKRRSFSRVAMVTPFHPSWGDAFYVRSVEAGGLITMSSLGKNGRFANQLFQYAFLKCYAQKHLLRVETPAWVGQKLFGFADPAISRRLPEFRERSNQLPDALVPNAAHPVQNVDFWGFFQYNTRYYAPQRDYFRSMFRPTPQALAHVQPMLEKLRSRGKTIVGLHLRRGDYGYEHFFVAPCAWYLEWLRSLWPTLEEPVLFIASDEPAKLLADFAEFNPVTAKDLGPTLNGADFYPDFFLLSQCDALAISNSSFSFAAAMLNERAGIFARPHLPAQKLIPFNPWNSETLLRDAKVEKSALSSAETIANVRFPLTPALSPGERETGIHPLDESGRSEVTPRRRAVLPLPEGEGRGEGERVTPDKTLSVSTSGLSRPRFSFVTIVLNGMPFLEFALRAVYDFAHEIIIVEGAVENCRFAATPDGSSTDGTVECIRNFPDPQKKIRLIQGAWPEKCEMQNAALEHVTGEYVWLMDSDEIYRRTDLDKVRSLIEKDASITQINVIPDNFWKGFDHIFLSPKFFEPAAHYRRIFKFVPGARFTSHRPPTMVHPGSKRSTEQVNCIRGDVTRAMGVVPFHYSYVVESQVVQKVELYNRYGWGKQWKIDMNEWLRECWQKWTPENRAEIEGRYPVWAGGSDSRTEPFGGEHPEVMRDFIQQWQGQKLPESQPPRRLKIAGEVATKADLTQIDSNSAFAQAIRKLFTDIRPTKVIETGTYLGTGTTKVIAEAIRDLKLKDVSFHSIEVKPQHFETAKRNLAKSGLNEVVHLHHGLSVPRLLLPTLQQIEEQTVRHVEFDGLFVDHQEHERALLYFKETDFSAVPEDLLGECLRQFENRPDFVLLDSAGHMGHLEFNYLLGQIKGPCHIALDDIHHIKHHCSFRQMQTDPRFELIVSSKEKFGFCIAKFTPAVFAGVDGTVQRLLWVRTDAIGDAALASSMLPHIRAKYPAAKIAVLCREHLAEFYLACPHVETIICFDWQKASQDETYRKSIVTEIAGFQPDLVLNSTYSREPLTELLALAFPAHQFIGMEGNLSNISAGAKQRLDAKYNQLIASPGEHKLELERHRDFLSGLGVSAEKLEPQVWTTPDDEAVATAFFAQEKLDPARTIALFPGAQNDRRIYPHYAEALKPFADFKFLIFGDEKAALLAEEMSAVLPGQCINIAGKTTLRETAALLRRCRLYVGAESAGAHFACALGVSNVVVLGGGHFGRFMPYSPLTSVACLPLDCFGCDWRCRHANPHCVKDVAPEVITEAIRDTLAKSSTKTRLFVQGESLWKPEGSQPRLGSLKGHLPAGEYEIICVEKRPATGGVPLLPLREERAGERRPICAAASPLPGPPPAPSSRGEGEPPLVTAIVSTYNSERFLRGCLEDLEAQTIADRLEIIVVDSGSEQNERSIVEEFQKKHSNIVYLRTEREPLYAAWNRAIGISRGQYLTNANTDDRHRADAYEILARTLDEHPVGIVYADSFTTNVENETFATTKSRRTFDWPEFTLEELLTRNFFGPHPMWRRSVHAEIGFFNSEYTIAGDYDFNLRVASKFGARRVPEVLGLYLEGGMESKNRKLCVDETRRVLRHHRREIAIEQIYPELRQSGLTPQRQAELLVDYAVTLATTWHPDVDLAKELYRCAAGICPEYVQAMEKASGKRGPEVSGINTISPGKVARTPGYSFCIITNGKRPVKLQQEIESIRALKIPAFEILVGGDVPAGLGEDVIVLPLTEAAQAGRLGEMRNRLIERARFGHLVVADDDMIFHADFFSGLKQFGEDYEVLCTRLINPDGSRFWDWATVGGPRGQTILDYDESDPFVYVTGGLCVMKASVADRVQWDEARGFYQSEDVDFSRRLQTAGISIRFNRHSTVTHNDARYTLDGPVVVRIEGALALAKQDYEADRTSMARHRLERALRLWPWAKSEILKFAAKFGDGPAIESMANQPVRPNPLPSEQRFEFKLPVRWAGPFFGEDDEAGRAGTLVEPLAKRVWLGIHHHGVPWVERAVESLPAEKRELLFAMADRFPAMLGGVGISQSAPENFAKLPGAAWSVGFVPTALKQLSPEQAACCREMDEVWVAETAQAEAFAKCGVPADKLRVMRNAEELFTRLQEIEAQLLEAVDKSTCVSTSVHRPHPKGEGESSTTLGKSKLVSSSVSVAWEGSFLDLGSLSHVNRAITAELAKEAGVDVTCIGRNAVPKELAAMDELQAMARRLQSHPSAETQVTVRHAWPPDWTRPKHGAWVLIQPWEFGALPVDWIQPLARVDEVWVPSEFVRRCYIDSGVDARKVHVVPNGIDPQRFNPQAKPRFLATQKKFKFLFVGGTIHRKGPDVLLKAFLESFTSADDVCLVIKDFGGQSVYAGQTFSAQIRAAQARPNAPEILYLTDDISAEDMPGLYTACDCLVHPYRGEGFGLPVLEAMACGVPVVVTAGGSTDDFATDELAYRIPAQRKEFGNSVSGMKLVKSGWLLEPDVAALGERLKWIVANPTEAKAKGQAAGENVRTQWTWARAASVAARRIRDIASRQSARPASKKMAKPIELPACARLGHLASARQLFQAGKLLPAWEATLASLWARPFHPEAFLMLAEIAQATGDATRAKALAEHARSLAPAWKPAKQFLKSPPRRGSAAVALPELPRALAPSHPAPIIPRLTVCLIAKNEERFIGQCLESIRPIADQIVVVDTGSTDWTTSIAGRFGAEIYKFQWCDDFSAARNAALEKATGDWVLMLDADEQLPAEQREKLLKLIRDPKAIAYRLPMIDVGHEEAGVSHVPRLFRNAPGLFYVGRVHEQVFSSVEVRRTEWGLENLFGDATLLHHGYTKEMVKSRDKVARNLRLLEMAVEEMPGEPNLLMNLGLELMRTGRTHEGLENYEAAFEAMGRLPKAQVVPELRESLLTQFATHLVAAKRFADVVRVLTSPVAKSGGLTASMHWLLGLACVELKQFSEGAAQMRDCLAKRERLALTPVLKDIRKGAPYHALAVCLVSMKQVEAARRAFESALKDEPENRAVRFDFARFLANNGEAVEALKWAHQLMADDPSDVAVWRFGGQVALGNPDFIEFARDWTSEAMKSHPDVPALAEQRATAMLLSGGLDEALPLWRQLGEGNPTVVAARLICEAGSGAALSSVSAVSSMTKVNEAFVLWYRRLLQFNATKAVLLVNARVEELRSFVPAAANVIGAAMAAAA